ncbi:SDR family NAD(P)-dependent oxidoreductase [Pseudovibrio sp. Tun.PSC04-5.I4]|uniref:SDR family NAD(P)-dependent oxidoreductase n=1 Tax=Pseudovibrio sp. Tun.PSC04-5.I4 TaxID=1798213 RepID=UPI00088F09C4|nr:SDR family NAD(P)-dependent oxidoreductase [Pseudovibrio sp. Tun.PSC04-5.I4]SDQ94360.1 NAD(P)-dependent dehydrogenase, short-chain alcohol dehydrogenase family [Pseudovibrio sp. Tun.PSC04-5.I4]
MPYSPKRIAIFGASGAIGSAVVVECAKRYADAQIFAFARTRERVPLSPLVHHHGLDVDDETSLAADAQNLKSGGGLDLVFVATGQLHSSGTRPEKTIRSLSASAMQEIYQANTVLPAIIMKHFLPLLSKDRKTVFAAISARVGSISDNRLGGWYSYRASKAALNMLIKCASVEMRRSHPEACLVGIHPGTVDSALSKPFQRAVPEGKLFSPSYSAGMILTALEHLEASQSGKCFAYDGTEIAP